MLSAIAKFVSGGFEALLAIPFIGGSIVIFSGYSALGTALVLHIITLIVTFVYRTAKTPSVVGIITSLLSAIPVVGWILHTIAAILLLASAVRDLSR
ncbi:hypothetical protein [Alteribacillus iranensis]|uniref:Uncharacterized protein n=1 Tax=Alteribacillus iranensis TaxID=930128 RepID=A0A1I2FI61_9BACI|nr:hypothetical protein [Alteribacillus iranensis]SFF04579.1 hypothetical protein SAMN05192532_11223 [Alteribacillus iranensis]